MTLLHSNLETRSSKLKIERTMFLRLRSIWKLIGYRILSNLTMPQNFRSHSHFSPKLLPLQDLALPTQKAWTYTTCQLRAPNCIRFEILQACAPCSTSTCHKVLDQVHTQARRNNSHKNQLFCFQILKLKAQNANWMFL